MSKEVFQLVGEMDREDFADTACTPVCTAFNGN